MLRTPEVFPQDRRVPRPRSRGRARRPSPDAMGRRRDHGGSGGPAHHALVQCRVWIDGRSGQHCPAVVVRGPTPAGRRCSPANAAWQGTGGQAASGSRRGPGPRLTHLSLCP